MIYRTKSFQNKEGCQICVPGLVYFPWNSGSLLQNQEGLAALLYEEANIFKLHIFGVEITTCLFPHIGKSNLRIKV